MAYSTDKKNRVAATLHTQTALRARPDTKTSERSLKYVRVIRVNHKYIVKCLHCVWPQQSSNELVRASLPENTRNTTLVKHIMFTIYY